MSFHTIRHVLVAGQENLFEAPIEFLLMIAGEWIDHGDHRRLCSTADMIEIEHTLYSLIERERAAMLDIVFTGLFRTFVCMPQTIDLVVLENSDRLAPVCAASPVLLTVASELAPDLLISSVF